MTSTDETDSGGVDLAGMSEYLSGTVVVFAVLFGSRARGTADESSDVDVALRFPEGLDDNERFHARNRIDAALQKYARGTVDVSDVDSLPTPVAYAALHDGVVLVGDEQAVREYRKRIEREHEATAEEQEREDRAFIDRLARGET